MVSRSVCCSFRVLVIAICLGEAYRRDGVPWYPFECHLSNNVVLCVLDRRMIDVRVIVLTLHCILMVGSSVMSVITRQATFVTMCQCSS